MSKTLAVLKILLNGIGYQIVILVVWMAFTFIAFEFILNSTEFSENYLKTSSFNKIPFAVAAAPVFKEVLKKSKEPNISLGILSSSAEEKKSLNITNYKECFTSPNSTTVEPFILQPVKCSSDVDLVWLIKSSIYRNSLRNSIRDTWGQQNFGDNVKIPGNIKSVRRIFLIGSMEDNYIMPMLDEENKIYGDILQGSFNDTYTSVTMKVLMGLKFATEFCQSVKFIVVADDDAAVVPWNLFKLLPANLHKKSEHYYAGFYVTPNDIIRDPVYRWYVPFEEYNCTHYGEYLSGSMFILSNRTAAVLFKESQSYNYFSMDDVFFGSIANDISVNLTIIEGFIECDKLSDPHSGKSGKNIVACHGAEYARDQNALWYEYCFTPSSSKILTQQILLYCRNIFDMTNIK